MSKVSRSVYQKLKEENKSLKRDLKTLCYPLNKITSERIEVFNKWKNHFKEEREFNLMMKEYAREWFENNQDDPLVKKLKEFKNE